MGRHNDAGVISRRRQAEAAMKDLLDIEPQLTVATLRERMMNVAEQPWTEYAAALRQAGLPR